MAVALFTWSYIVTIAVTIHTCGYCSRVCKTSIPLLPIPSLDKLEGCFKKESGIKSAPNKMRRSICGDPLGSKGAAKTKYIFNSSDEPSCLIVELIFLLIPWLLLNESSWEQLLHTKEITDASFLCSGGHLVYWCGKYSHWVVHRTLVSLLRNFLSCWRKDIAWTNHQTAHTNCKQALFSF